MSHSRIFQISEKPLVQENFITDDDFHEHWFVGSVAEYVSGDNDRSEDIRCLRDRLTNLRVARFGIDKSYSRISFVILPEGKERYFSHAYERFVEARKKTIEMGLPEFASGVVFAGLAHQMESAFCEKFAFYVSQNENEFDIVPLDEFIRGAEVGQRYYIGGVLDYHY